MEFISELYDRNSLIFVFGFVNFSLAVLFFVLSKTRQIKVAGINAWYKPIKFALSIGIFVWTMAWFTYYLQKPVLTKWYSWGLVILLGFEILYIGIQAYRGQRSHFNLTSAFYRVMYIIMASAASIVSLWTGIIGIQFFIQPFPELSIYYLWAIRLGILLFVIFSLEGFVMGSRLSHTIGGPDGGKGLPFLNWSRKFGDPRVAHFIGMHALQVLPLLSIYLLKNVYLTLLAGVMYGLLALFVLIQALQGKVFLKFIK